MNGMSSEEHFQKLKELLKGLQIHGFTINSSKHISLHQTYLEHYIGAETIHLWDGKTKMTKTVPQNTDSGHDK